MSPKYEITPDTLEFDDGLVVHRIRALRDLLGGTLPAGSLGGFVQSEANLSHDGDAWVGGEAVACEEARVEGDALLDDHAVVRGRAVVRDMAMLRDDAEVCDDAAVGGATVLSGSSRVFGRAVVEAGEDGPTILPGVAIDFDLRYGEDHAVFGHSEGEGRIIAVSGAGRVCMAGTWGYDSYAGDLDGLRAFIGDDASPATRRLLAAVKAWIAGT